ncbi:hypothetical protein LRS10_13620 [Phenylobacterium sp. J426]|uniref:hypothetical protein n=1 Tax=Phenylobacterium sp. J426 TaxID=2898439 RepID=UPI00215165D0|nr:hypothetical protein [Phenylobacterium sp. J426]MCR5875132.1 hypothetical protein [Phenylobacterium sp. J426]
MPDQAKLLSAAIIDLSDEKLRRVEESPALKAKDLPHTPGERISRSMTDATQDLVDAKIAASEARTATAFERAMGEMRIEFASLRGDIQALEAKTASKATVISTAITLFFGIAALLVAFLAFGNDMFSSGLNSGQVAQEAAERAVAQRAVRAPPQAPAAQ